MTDRMSAEQRRAQILTHAAQEFAVHGLHGASIDTIAKHAGITQAYVFRIFGTKKALFLELVEASFAQLSTNMGDSAANRSGLDALSAMGQRYYDLLSDRTALRLQLQGFAACGDPEVQRSVREGFAHLWGTTANGTGLDPVTIKAFLAFGMLLNAGAAMEIDELDEAWAEGLRTRINPNLFAHITTENNDE